MDNKCPDCGYSLTYYGYADSYGFNVYICNNAAYGKAYKKTEEK